VARIEYPLTPMGRGLALPFMAMTACADKWLGGGFSPLTMRSRSTGQTLSVVLVDECGERARREDIELIADPKVSRQKQDAGRARGAARRSINR
jgi:hypothetical protein